MTVVMDVSGAVTILLKREKADKFLDTLQGSTMVIAPDLYVSELTNVLWKYYAAKILTKDECTQYIYDGIDYIDRFVDSRELWQEAFSEGISNHHSIYDMFYLAVAKRSGGTLITNDSVLAGIGKKNHVTICY